MASDESNRRQNIRMQPETGRPVRIDINGENFLDIVHAMDLSTSGARIAVPHGFEGCRLDKMVSLVVDLPEPISTSFVTLGSIRHLSGRAFGVKFVDLEGPDRRAVKEYLTHLMAQKFWLRTMLFKLGILQ